MTRNVLYLSYEGITDHIGQSQVAPYLIRLSALGHRITLLTAEKMQRQDIIDKYQKIFKEAGIDWQIVSYTKKPPVFSSIYDLYRMRARAAQIIRDKKIEVIHARSYLPALLALYFRKRGDIKFIFDMRDFWADAGKETKRFNQDTLMGRKVYSFFKAREAEYLQWADHIVSLTESGKRVINGWNEEGKLKVKAPISVIPCCADFSFYDRTRLDSGRLEEQRKKLGIPDDAFVLNYLGSLGPAYLTDEMMDVFKVLLQKRPDAYFLIVANNDHGLARNAAERRGIPADRIVVLKAEKEEVPYLIAQADLSLFFIMPSFAKQACSPTKLAELLAMNVPVMANTKVGDLDTLLDVSRNHSAVVHSFDDAEYGRVLDAVLESSKGGNNGLREASRGYFSLESGVETYDRIYQTI